MNADAKNTGAKFGLLPIDEAFLPGFLKDPVGRRHLNSIGSLLIVLFVVATLLIWVRLDFARAVDTNGWVLFLAKAFAFTGITLLSLNIILSSKLWFLEGLFGGLDKVYKVHGFVGRLTWMFLLLHAGLIIWSTGPQWEIAKYYLIPGLDWPHNLGPIALLIMDIVLILTLFVRMPYETWKLTHKFMALPLLIGAVHAVWGGSDVLTNDILKYWIIGLAGFGLVAYLYNQLLFRYLGPRFKMKVMEVRSLGEVTEIYMKPVRKGIQFYPGQFIFVSFVKSAGGVKSESHPFSISGVDGDMIRISPKASGDFSESLKRIKTDDEVLIWGPYGNFAERYLTTKKPMVWIAGGIGVTPFLSMLQYEVREKKDDLRKVSMFYSVTDDSEVVYDEEIVEGSKGLVDFDYKLVKTEEEGRLTGEKIAESLGDGDIEKGREILKKSTIFICGPVPMMRALTQQMVKIGIRPRNIVYEEFGFR